MILTIPSSTNSGDHGDLRPRRSVRRLIDRVPFESQPDFFLPAPKMKYLDSPSFNKKGVKRLEKTLGILSADDFEQDPEPGFRYQASDAGQANSLNSQPEAVEFSLGGLVELALKKPELFKQIQEKIGKISVFEHKKTNPNIDHAALARDPSELLDSINLKMLN